MRTRCSESTNSRPSRRVTRTTAIVSRESSESKDPFLRVHDAFALLLLGCASAAPHPKTAPLNEPEIHISQLSSVSEAARQIAGGISVQYRVDIGNRANVPITIKRIEVISLGAGAYTLRPTSYPFNARLNAGETTAPEILSGMPPAARLKVV